MNIPECTSCTSDIINTSRLDDGDDDPFDSEDEYDFMAGMHMVFCVMAKVHILHLVPLPFHKVMTMNLGAPRKQIIGTNVSRDDHEI
jgi:hypothetical protein